MYDHVRPLSYTRADLFVIVFSVVEPASFERVETKVSYNHVPIEYQFILFFAQWHKEILKYNHEAPIILIGTKIDLREDPDTLDRLAQHKKTPITKKMGAKMAKHIRAVCYLENSALTQSGLKVSLNCVDGIYINHNLFRIHLTKLIGQYLIPLENSKSLNEVRFVLPVVHILTSPSSQDSPVPRSAGISIDSL